MARLWERQDSSTETTTVGDDTNTKQHTHTHLSKTSPVNVVEKRVGLDSLRVSQPTRLVGLEQLSDEVRGVAFDTGRDAELARHDAHVHRV